MKFAIPLVVVVITGLVPVSASASPTAEVAKRCIHYSYLAYPYKRPGSVRMSGDRQAYLKDCMAKDGSVPMPASVKPLTARSLP
jgi:hypothetical protein